MLGNPGGASEVGRPRGYHPTANDLNLVAAIAARGLGGRSNSRYRPRRSAPMKKAEKPNRIG